MEFKFMNYLNFLLNIRFLKPILATILLLMMAISSLNIYIDSKLPDEEKIRDRELQVPLKIYTSDLKLIGEFGEKRRTALKFENIPQHYINAVLAAEDDSFFEHSGVSYSGLVRSFYRLLIFGRIQGGGSTITQQLAKNLFKIRREKKGKLSGVPFLGLVISKVKEWIVAVKLEEFYTKKEILAMYLNTAEYGSNSYGIKVAAKTYFNKLPSELNYNESSIIVGLLNKPTKYNPYFNPDNATEKRAEIFYNLYN